jgi:hypothetical protein
MLVGMAVLELHQLLTEQSRHTLAVAVAVLLQELLALVV